MATKTTVVLEDDLDGGPADETVRFGRGGTEYEIDLNRENAWAFRKQLAPFVEHARKVGLGVGADRIKPSRSGDIRARAKCEGIVVGARVRILASVVEQYQPPPKDPDAHPLTAGMNQSAQPAQTASVPSQGCWRFFGIRQRRPFTHDTYGWRAPCSGEAPCGLGMPGNFGGSAGGRGADYQVLGGGTLRGREHGKMISHV